MVQSQDFELFIHNMFFIYLVRIFYGKKHYDLSSTCCVYDKRT